MTTVPFTTILNESQESVSEASKRTARIAVVLNQLEELEGDFIVVTDGGTSYAGGYDAERGVVRDPSDPSMYVIPLMEGVRIDPEDGSLTSISQLVEDENILPGIRGVKKRTLAFSPGLGQRTFITTGKDTYAVLILRKTSRQDYDAMFAEAPATP